MSLLFILLNSNRARLYAAGVPISNTKTVVLSPTNALLKKQVRSWGSYITLFHTSSVGVNCKNGMSAPGLNISRSVLSELSIAQRNGTTTQTAARQAMAIAMNLDTHFELRQSGFSTATLSWFYSMRLRIVCRGSNLEHVLAFRHSEPHCGLHRILSV